MKIYADKVAHVITDVEIVEVYDEIAELRYQNYEEFVLRYKGMNDILRSILDTNKLLNIKKVGENTIVILTFDVEATDFNVFKHGEDEEGVYIEIDESEYEKVSIQSKVEVEQKYKIGDVVRVRFDLEEGWRSGGVVVPYQMTSFRGSNVTITAVLVVEGVQWYSIKEDDDYWYWTDEMFEG